MSEYPSLLPDNLSSNTYNDGKITYTVSASSLYSGYQAYYFFKNANDYQGITSDRWPPHYIYLSSSEFFVTDQFDFTACWDLVSMTIKNYTIEYSINGDDWIQIYSGIVPATTYYDAKCEYDKVICKHIRLKVLSTYDTRGHKWTQAKNFRVFGFGISMNSLFEDDGEMYGIPK